MVKVFTKAPLIVRSLFFLILPLFLLAWGGYNSYVDSALPSLKGEQYVTGISQDVVISRDEFGVVYIDAKTDEDIFFAMGYVHAQDRLWQLELQRRLSQGKMAEVFGEPAVNSDVWMRTVGIYDSALKSKKNLSEQATRSLQAYSNGINAWLDESHALPLEFSVFDIGFDKWKVEDSLAWQKMFALNLAGNYRYELLKYVGKQYQSVKAFNTIFSSNINGYDEDIAQLPLDGIGHLIDLQNHIEQDVKVGGEYVGSNAFVISGDHTESGMPILANDPHLAIQIPSLWYAVSQNGEKLKARGFSLVGLPVVIFGRNEHISWGGTNMMADVQDLVIESINSSDPEQYLHQQQWTRFETRTERVNVKAPFPSFLRAPYKPIEFTVRTTRNGPVISDAVPGFDQVVSLKWVALTEQDKTFESFLRANYATDLNQFRASFENYVAPALNILYADNNNNIARLGIGKIPIRASGDGTMPQPAVNQGEQWTGYIPYEEMPFELNPKSGFIVNANNKNIEKEYPYLISTMFAPEHRANRITTQISERLTGQHKISIEDTVSIMKDEKDLAVEALLALLIEVKPASSKQSAALEYLRSWDGVASENAIAPAIFYGWVRHIKKQVFPVDTISVWSQKVHDSYVKSINSMITEERLAVLLKKDDQWCSRDEQSEPADCNRVLLTSLDRTIDELSKLKGKDMADWQWGEIQTTLYAHTPFSEIESIKFLFERDYQTGGSANTVSVSAGYFDESSGYIKNFGAGFRQVMEMSDSEQHHYIMNSTGQSGQAASPHYDDMVMPFKDHALIPVNSQNAINFFKLYVTH